MFLLNEKDEKTTEKSKEMTSIEIAIAKSQLERGVIVINSAFDNKLYGQISSLIDYLVFVKRRTDILIEINSPGGVITDGLAIYDKIKSVEKHCNVHTVVTGMAASMGAALLCMGTEGKRYSYPNSTIMIHQPLSGFGVGMKIKDLEIQVGRTQKVKRKLMDIMSKTSKLSFEEMSIACDRDNYLSAEEALAYGLIDKIITELPEEFMVK